MQLFNRFAWCLVAVTSTITACGGGESSPAPVAAPPPTSITLELPHQDLVFDPTRQLYYASITSSNVLRGNRIVTLDRSGSIVATSEPVGSRPTTMAVAPDGASIYIGLRGTGELARYSLPGFALMSRLSLPRDSFSGQTYADDISPSPTSPGVVVVSLTYDAARSPRYGGVVLVRDMVIQPGTLSGFKGSNQLRFDRLGQSIYGIDSESTSPSLRKIDQTSSGLREVLVRGEIGAMARWRIEVIQDLILVGGQAFAVGSFAPRGSVEGAAVHCVSNSNGTQVACLSAPFGRILFAETTNFTRVGEVIFLQDFSLAPFKLVAGPAGQVAASELGLGRIFFVNNESFR